MADIIKTAEQAKTLTEKNKMTFDKVMQEVSLQAELGRTEALFPFVKFEDNLYANLIMAGFTLSIRHGHIGETVQVVTW
jgi:hypothetical protein